MVANMIKAELYILLFDTADRSLSTVIDQDIHAPYDVLRRCAPLDQSLRDAIRSSTMTTKDLAKLGDYIENAIDWPICSTSFASVLQIICKDSVEIVAGPKLVNSQGSERGNIKAFNVLQSPSCVDIQNSTVAYASDGRIRNIYDLRVLWHEVPRGVQAFRPKEYPATIIITKSLAEALTEHKVSGVAFLPIADVQL
jgi:hypothetical protein